MTVILNEAATLKALWTPSIFPVIDIKKVAIVSKIL